MEVQQRKGAREEGDKREAVMAAALELFAAQGYHGTPVPRIAERAGVGAGTIYRYFEGKDALVNALYQRWKAEFLRTLSEGYPREVPVRQQFGFLFRRMCGFEREFRAAFAFLEFHYHGGYLDEASRALRTNAMDFVFQFIEGARAQDALNDLSSEAIVALVFGGFTGLVQAREVGRLEWSPALLEETEAALWAAIAARPADEGPGKLRDTIGKRSDAAGSGKRQASAPGRRRRS